MLGDVVLPFKRFLISVDYTFRRGTTKVRQHFWFCFSKVLVVYCHVWLPDQRN